MVEQDFSGSHKILVEIDFYKLPEKVWWNRFLQIGLKNLWELAFTTFSQKKRESRFLQISLKTLVE